MTSSSVSKLVRKPQNAIESLRRLKQDVAAVKKRQKGQGEAIKQIRSQLESLAARQHEQLVGLDHLDAALAAEAGAREELGGVALNSLASKAALARLEQAVRRIESASTSIDRGDLVLDADADSKPQDAEADMPPRLYLSMEDVLRGDPADIETRQRPYVDKLVELLPQRGVIADLGCGRGEFVGGLKAAGFNPIGVDTNPDALDEIRARGIDVSHRRADHYLESQPDESLDGVTAFHLVEHIPTSAMVHLFEEAFRTLRLGGVLAIETPNPENLRVGAHTFWLDPTHLKPVPPMLIETLLRDIGFEVESSLRLSPHPDYAELLEMADSDLVGTDLVNALYGPQDFGVIAIKR